MLNLPSRGGSGSPSGRIRLNFCNIDVKKRNSSILARDSPKQCRLPKIKILKFRFKTLLEKLIILTCFLKSFMMAVCEDFFSISVRDPPKYCGLPKTGRNNYRLFSKTTGGTRRRANFFIITARIRRMGEGTVFSLFVSPHLDGGGVPKPSLDTGGGVPQPSLDGVPPNYDWMG